MYTIKNVSGNLLLSNELRLIDEVCFPGDCWSVDTLSSELGNDRVIILAAYDNDDIVGYLDASYILDEAELNRICVLPRCRKCGIADNLINEFLKQCSVMEISVVHLEVRSKNDAAVSLYKKHSFLTDAVRKNYYHNPPDDALLMTLNLKVR